MNYSKLYYSRLYQESDQRSIYSRISAPIHKCQSRVRIPWSQSWLTVPTRLLFLFISIKEFCLARSVGADIKMSYSKFERV